ncbi:MAG: hypothetical protein ABSE93_01910 [Terriglobia bacterium]|jgi:hypothetical protein
MDFEIIGEITAIEPIAAGWRRHASFPHVCDFPKGQLLASHRLSERYWKQADPTRHSAR